MRPTSLRFGSYKYAKVCFFIAIVFLLGVHILHKTTIPYKLCAVLYKSHKFIRRIMNTNQINGRIFPNAVLSLDDVCQQHRNKISEGDHLFFRILNDLTVEDFINYSSTCRSAHTYSRRLIKLTQPKLEKFVDMTNLISLGKCMGSNTASAHLIAAQKIAAKIYECMPRGIESSQYGSAYNMNPELLSYAMFLAKNEVVLEIAGANGENAALLAFSDAKHVYMNDIEPTDRTILR